MVARPLISVVDDDESIRESLPDLLREFGFEVQIFSSAADFLAHPRTATPSCLVLDVSLPDLNGLELQKLIASERTDMPNIFITGHGDVPMSVQAMKAGVKLGISEITVKAHRGKVMQKMNADSLAGLVKTAVRLGLTPAKNPWHKMVVEERKNHG